jgi:hypothetical protein
MLSLETTRNLCLGEEPANTSSANKTPATTAYEPDLRMRALCIAHDDLDAAIAALLQTGRCDDLLLTRLKKRKLQLKDDIAACRTLSAPAMVSQAS